jgi:hypothetical protein
MKKSGKRRAANPREPSHAARVWQFRRRGFFKLANSLRDFSRIEAGRARAVVEPTDLAQFTADLAN